MLILKYNQLPAQDMFIIERHLVRWLDNKGPKITPEWHVLELARTDLYGHLLGVFAHLNVYDTLAITPSKLLDFLVDVDTAYHHTPYHSFYHATDITMILYYILTDLDAWKQLGSMDMAPLLIAALCHDIGHPGYNNLYQVNSKTALAQKYNNTSVLEHHSVDITHDLLIKHRLFDNVSYDWKDSIKRLILSTDFDMYHYELQEKAGALVEAMGATWADNHDDGNDGNNHENSSVYTNTFGTNENGDYPNSHDNYISTTGIIRDLFDKDDDVDGLNMDDNDDDDDGSHDSSDTESQWLSEPPTPTLDQPFSSNNRTSPSPGMLSTSQCHDFCQIILHAADISNTVRPWAISKQWSDLIVQEFFQQGDAEKQTGLDVSPGMDRDVSHQANISLKFGDFVVRPYFEALVRLLPNSRVFLTTLAENRIEWMQCKDSPATMMALTPPPPPQERHLLTPMSASNPSGRRVSVTAGLAVIPDKHRLRSWQKQQHPPLQRWLLNHRKKQLSPRSSSPSPPSLTAADYPHRITKPTLSPLQQHSINRLSIRSVSQPVILPDLIFHHSDTTTVIGTTSQLF